MSARGCLAFVLLATTAAGARSERAGLGPFTLGGRAEYATSIDRDAVPFPWNDATHSLHDRTRLMLDMASDDARFGTLYLKGTALWDEVRPSDVRKRFRFEQGDYLWAREKGKLDYSLRFFANERRFFVEDAVAPLLDDDAAANGADNAGARIDGAWNGGVSATGIFSVVGRDFEASPRLAYLGARYAEGFANLGVSYLITDRGEHAPRNQAMVKIEATAAYRRTYLALAYEQSQFADRGFFFPNGHFDWDKYDGGNFAASLPAGGAFIAELRATEIDLEDRARLRLAYRYEAAGRDFANDLGWNHAGNVGHTIAAAVLANDVDLNTRLRYQVAERFNAESETRNTVDGTVWGALRAGIWFVVRGAVADVRNSDADAGNFVHVGVERRIREMRSGAHIMWRDLGTLFSERRFAVDAKFPVTPNWGFYFRVIAARDFDMAQGAFIRLDYRPSDRIFATFSYGGSGFGDGPYLIEDPDIDLARGDTAVYRISIRGDF